MSVKDFNLKDSVIDAIINQIPISTMESVNAKKTSFISTINASKKENTDPETIPKNSVP